MIDFHSHIIPEIDDGSRSIEETMLLLKEAQEAGFTDIISTSHYAEGQYEFDDKSRKQFLDIIKVGADNCGLNLKIHMGSEVFISYDIVENLKEFKASTINNTNYVLVELPMQSEIPNLKNTIYNLLSSGYRVIIAHPERYTYVKKDPNWLLEYIELGILFQANYASIIGLYGKEAQKTVKLLLKNNMIHFLGSDVHRAQTIYPKIPEILKKLGKILESKQLLKITTINPTLVLNNKEIEIEIPKKVKSNFWS